MARILLSVLFGIGLIMANLFGEKTGEKEDVGLFSQHGPPPRRDGARGSGGGRGGPGA